MRVSKYLPLYIGGLSAVAFGLAFPSAKAQEAGHNVCQSVGNPTPQQLGDREGHVVVISLNSCRVTEGPMAGALLTDTVMWEWDGAKANLLSDSGYGGKAGAFIAFQAIDGKLEAIMTDGKFTGWTGSGHQQIKLATGSAASSNGKTITWTGKSAGPNQYEYEVDYTIK